MQRAIVLNYSEFLARGALGWKNFDLHAATSCTGAAELKKPEEKVWRLACGKPIRSMNRLEQQLGTDSSVGKPKTSSAGGRSKL